MDEIAFVSELAKSTGIQILDRYWKKSLNASQKSDKSIVTEADRFADEHIVSTLREKFPDDCIISEENFTILEDNFCSTWVVDPLDGTANFHNGVPIWGVSIARFTNGYPNLGVLYFPNTDELYVAQSGKGLYLNGQLVNLEIKAPRSFFACCSRTHRHYNVKVPYKTRILGSVTYNLVLISRGDAAINIEVAPKLWDVAAAWVVVQEAGAEIEIFAGETPFPLKAGIDYDKFQFSTLAAVTKTEMEKAHRWITPID